MKTVFLDADTLGGDMDLSGFSRFGEVEIFGTTSPRQTAQRLADADFAVVNKVRLNGDTLGTAPKLKLICVAATGYDNLDLSYLRQRGIAACNVVGYSTQSVAQVTVSMALSLITHLPEYRAAVADGSYSRGGVANRLTPVYHEIAGKTWGIVGYGNIGKQVGAVAQALGCRVLVYKRTPVPDAECVDLDTLCARSDVISLHVPLNDGTRGMIDRRRVGLMKKDAVLINVARGAVCDEAALCEAMARGDLGGLGVDVYSTEPFPEDSPYAAIKDLPGVCLTPHMAWGAYEARKRCLNEMEKNIESFLAGGRRCRLV